jgi:hypothetical protein
MAAFVAEGRVDAATPISPWSAGPFAPAAQMLDLQALQRQAPRPSAPRPQAASAAQARPAPTRPAEVRPVPAQAVRPVPAAGPTRPLLVWATLAPAAAGRFQAALASFGPCAVLRPGLWLVRAGVDAAALRNALSRGLRGNESLLVVEAPLEQAAWFNLGQSAERDLRQFWGG